ncbi:aminopeptidase N [Nocardioides dongkuii]|uniref:aminopeptidase N n=1 Tax=Nocardioides dongkuii TaxID=2760089 RepID=UPI0015FC0947|nr:aminopeptidase N [Nocardioides dongkuii]
MSEQQDPQEPHSLTRAEAEERAALLAVDRYDIEVDLRGLLAGERWSSVSTVTFRCHRPGASTFVDVVGEVRSATLNGEPLDLAALERGRLPLTGLADQNVLVVALDQDNTGEAQGILRTVDATDDLVYVWTSLEPDEARRLWACFDQPDLKAPHAFTVHAPADWTVLSCSAPGPVADATDGAGGRTWAFPDTPPLSTYVVVVNAGPFHEIRKRRGDHDLGLYCRQSLRPVLERDAADLFTITEQGLAFFGERFGTPFPQERYDQVFVPNMGGAMENWGSVTHGDDLLPRSEPTPDDRYWTAAFVLHEMAHMWFGDLVTMRWWDDLWLNEAFASWAATWAMASATEHTDAWATFLAAEKLAGYDEDMSPAAHPIRTEVADVAHAMANFDGITYYKGQAVLRQLVEYVGEEAFTRGLQAYFAEHAWGNTTLADLVRAVGEASGRDLEDWTVTWLDRAGTDTLVLQGDQLVGTSPDGGLPRPHRLAIGSFRRDGDRLERIASTSVELVGDRAQVTLPDADLHLVNDGDQTFAATRADEASTRALLASAGDLPDALSRAVAVATAWDLLFKGEAPARTVADCLIGVLEHEDSPAVVESFLGRTQSVVERWLPTADLAAVQERLADVAVGIAQRAGLRSAGLRALAASATREDHFAILDGAAAENTDLAWRYLARRAELGHAVEDEVQRLLKHDPDPEAPIRAIGVRAAAADEAGKAAAWAALFTERSVPAGGLTAEVATRFWRPGQEELLLPWAHRWFDEITSLPRGGLLGTMSLVRASYPTLADDDVLERARSVAESDVPAPVRAMLLMGADRLSRMLRARAA